MIDKSELILMDQQIKTWLKEDRQLILNELNSQLTVHTKNSRKDLVTNVDKQSEQFLVNKIRSLGPNNRILGEEGLGDSVKDTAGRVWIVDPIDGTMNFVKQHEHFAVMIGLYDDGQPVLGYILDVMKNQLISGGPQIGITENGNPISAPDNTGLRDGLIGLSGPLLIRNDHQMLTIGEEALGVRIYGSAGIDILAVLTGELIGYISYLRPWDFGAGKVLADTLGLSFTTIDGQPLGMLSSGIVLIATKSAHKDILTIVSQ